MTRLEELLAKYAEQHERCLPNASSDEYFESCRLYGGALRALGRWEDAVSIFRSAIDTAQKVGSRPRACSFLIWVSNVEYHRGHYSRAVEIATRALCECDDASQRLGILRYYLARPTLRIGDHERYAELIDEAACSVTAGTPDYERAWIDTDRACAMYLRGQPDASAALCQTQVTLFRTLSHRFGLPYALLCLGEITAALDESRSASAIEEAMSLYTANGQEGFVVDCLVLRAKALQTRGEPGLGLKLVDDAVAECRLGPRKAEGLADQYHLLKALLLRAELLIELGDVEGFDVVQEESRRLLTTYESPELYRFWMSNQTRR